MYALVFRWTQPKTVSVRSFFCEDSKKLGHLTSKVPAIDRATVNNDKAIAETQLRSPIRTMLRAEFEHLQICATRNYLVIDMAADEPGPLPYDGPDPFSKGDQTVRSGQRPAFHRLCQSIGKT